MTDTAPATLPELQKQFEAELAKRFDERDNDLLGKLDKRLRDEVAKVVGEVAARQGGFSLPGSADAAHKKEKYSFTRAIACVQNGMRPDLAPMELAMSQEIAKTKTMTYGDSEAGGFFVPNEVAAEVIELLRADAVVMQAGARSLPNLTRAPFQIPRVSGGCVAGWGSELATIAATQLAAEMAQLNPHRLAAVVPFSDLFTILDNHAAETIVRQDLGREMALKLDLAALKGDGNPAGEPLGVFSATAVGTSTLTDPATYDELIDFVATVRAANALKGQPAWIMSNADLTELEKMKDLNSGGTNTTHQQLARRRLFSEDGKNILNWPHFMSTQLADGDVVFGNWQDMLIGQWGGLRFDSTNALGFLTGQTHLRVVTYADILIRHVRSFCIPA